MKNRVGIELISIKTNKTIIFLLKKNIKINLSIGTIWFNKTKNVNVIEYALLVGKSQFKLAAIRNKVKRQLRMILIQSDLKGGLQILIKPNKTYIDKQYNYLSNCIILAIKKNNGQ